MKTQLHLNITPKGVINFGTSIQTISDENGLQISLQTCLFKIYILICITL